MNRRCARKGQMVFEFIIATMFFLAIVVYTISFLNSRVLSYQSAHFSSMQEANAWQASEILVRNPGIWTGDPPVPESLGLASEWPVLNETRMARLDTWCQANGPEVLRLLDIPDGHQVRIDGFVKDTGGESRILECGSVPGELGVVELTRFGVSDVSRRPIKVVVTYL